jgi:chloramphenicol 3-O-phosphotransferase
MAMQLVIISGPPHAGKSSTARALCDRYDRMLHIDVAVLRDFLAMGRLRPWDGSPEGRRQRELLIASGCDMARRFRDAGYGVVIDDVVLPDDLPLYSGQLLDAGGEAHLAVLLPPLAVVLDRERAQPSEWRAAGRLEEAYRLMQASPPVTIDPIGQTPELVADRIMSLASEGSLLLREAKPTQ